MVLEAQPADAKAWTSAAAPVESIIIAPELRDSATAIDAKPLRVSQAPDTVIDAKPLPKHEPVRPRAAVAELEPISLPTRSNMPLIVVGLGGVFVLLLAAGGYFVFGGDTTVAVAPPLAAPVAAVGGNPVPPVAAMPPTAPVTAVPPVAVVAPVAPIPPVAAVAPVVAEAAPVVEAPAPATRTLRVRVEPSGASVTVDGQPITVPYEVALPEGSDHVVVASLEGYATETERVSLRRDASVSMRLDRIRERATSASAASSSSPRIGSRIRRGGAGSGAAGSGSGSGSSGTSSGSGTFVTESPY